MPPQFSYQAPPGAQQLSLPDFLKVPHLRHTGLIGTSGVHMWVLVTENREIDITPTSKHFGLHTCILHSPGRELTFASIDALDPRVINVSVAGTTAVLEPSTAGSATTEFAGFLRGAALGTHDTGCRCDGRCRAH